MRGFYETVNAAIRDIEDHGFDSIKRIQEWQDKIVAAARRSMMSEAALQKALHRTFHRIYDSMLKGGYAKVAPGVSRFTVEQLRPKLRRELERRMMTSQQLIKLNRDASIEKIKQRFGGWASSIPAGGTRAVNNKDVSKNVRKALTQLPFEERRVMIDQGQKFFSDLAETIALDNEAIAARWHSHWRQPGYDYREDHKERDLVYFMIRGNWALEQGLIKPGPGGYTDEITRPGEEVFCRCDYEYIYNIRDLPDYMLTEKGRKSLNQGK